MTFKHTLEHTYVRIYEMKLYEGHVDQSLFVLTVMIRKKRVENEGMKEENKKETGKEERGKGKEERGKEKGKEKGMEKKRKGRRGNSRRAYMTKRRIEAE
jgi:hypothetical protein